MTRTKLQAWWHRNGDIVWISALIIGLTAVICGGSFWIASCCTTKVACESHQSKVCDREMQTVWIYNAATKTSMPTQQWVERCRCVDKSKIGD